jgi:hypothetical protein
MHSSGFVEERYISESCILEGADRDPPRGFPCKRLYMIAVSETGAAHGHERQMAGEE